VSAIGVDPPDPPVQIAWVVGPLDTSGRCSPGAVRVPYPAVTSNVTVPDAERVPYAAVTGNAIVPGNPAADPVARRHVLERAGGLPPSPDPVRPRARCG
jgi:hypothetical protein